MVKFYHSEPGIIIDGETNAQLGYTENGTVFIEVRAGLCNGDLGIVLKQASDFLKKHPPTGELAWHDASAPKCAGSSSSLR